MKRSGVTIIGLGALGKSLTQAFLNADIPVKSIFNRTGYRASQLADENEIAIANSFPEDASQLGTPIFLTVPDGAISEVSYRVAQLSDDLSGKKIVHCSGNEMSSILSAVKKKGAAIASMHPLQTFSAASSADDFQNIYCSLEGDAEVLPVLEKLAAAIGAKTVRVSGEQKSHLHAAAVMASNYIVTLLDASAEIGELSGLNRKKVQQLINPLVQTAIQNGQKASFEKAISGPIARGDVETVQQHLKLLEKSPKLRTFYAQLGLQTVGKVEETMGIDKGSAEKLYQILGE